MSLSFSSSLSFSLSSNLQRRAAGRQEEEGGSTPTKPQQPGKHNQAENHGGISTSPKTWSKENYLHIFVPRGRYSPLLLDGPSYNKPDLLLVNPKIGIFLELSGKRSLGRRSLGVLVLVVLQQLCKLEMFRALSI